MNEHHEQLDARAAGAAADLRARAAARPRPPFEADEATHVALRDAGTRPTGRSRSVVAAAAVVALLVGGAAWWSNGRDGTDPTTVAATADGPRPFVLGEASAGFNMTRARDLVADRRLGDEWSEAFGPVAVYGSDLARPELGVLVLDRFDASEEPAVEPVEVGGAEAFTLPHLGPENVLVVHGDAAVVLFSATLDRAALVETATHVDVAGGRPVLADDALPRGWRHLGDTNGTVLLSPMSIGWSPAATFPGSAVSYASETDDSVLVTSTEGWELDVHATALMGATIEEVTIGGRQALVVTYPEGSMTKEGRLRTASWLERPGELVRVSAVGLSSEEVRALAEGVEPIAPDAWDDLLARSRLGDLEPESDEDDGPEPAEVARGAFDDGTGWVLRASEELGTVFPELSVDLPVHAMTASEASTAMPGEAAQDPLFAIVSLAYGDRRFAAGLVSDAVAAVELQSGSGAGIDRLEPVEGAGYRGWAGEYNGDLVVVAFDADGKEIARRVVRPDGTVEQTTLTPTPVEGEGPEGPAAD